MGSATVNWMGRNLADPRNPFGNHHYILILADSGLLSTWMPVLEYKGSRFLTLGGFSVGGNMVFNANNEADVASAKDLLDNTPIWDLLNPFDWGTQKHYVRPPSGSDFLFANAVIQLADNYRKNTAVNPLPYTVYDDNCAAWVNTLLKVAGVSKSERTKLGQFWGIDWAERLEIPNSLFNATSGVGATIGTYPSR